MKTHILLLVFAAFALGAVFGIGSLGEALLANPVEPPPVQRNAGKPGGPLLDSKNRLPARTEPLPPGLVRLR